MTFYSSADAYEICVSKTGPGCSKLTVLLFSVSLKFQMLISEICQYFLLEKNGRSFCTGKTTLIFFQQKISVYLVLKQ